jgi:hypothetical protein
MRCDAMRFDSMRCESYLYPFPVECLSCRADLLTIPRDLGKATQSLLHWEAKICILCHFDERESFSISRRPASMGLRRLHRACYSEAEVDTTELARQRYGGSTRTPCRESFKRIRSLVAKGKSVPAWQQGVTLRSC